MITLSKVTEKEIVHGFFSRVHDFIEDRVRKGELMWYIAEKNEKYPKPDRTLPYTQEDWEVRTGVRLYTQKECEDSPADSVPRFFPFHLLLEHTATRNKYVLTLEWDYDNARDLCKEYCCIEKLRQGADIQRLSFTDSTIMPFCKRITADSEDIVSRLTITYEVQYIPQSQKSPSKVEGLVLLPSTQRGFITWDGETDAFLQLVCHVVTK